MCELEEHKETSQGISRITGQVIPEFTRELISEVGNPRIFL